MYIWLYCCLFFFKQKTAYEMRISDWSSDVCSSDLDQQSTPGGGSGATPITLVVVEELVVPSWVVLVAPDGTDVLVAAAGSARTPAKSRPVTSTTSDRKSVESGKSVSVRVDLGGRRIIKKKKHKAKSKSITNT